MGKNQSKKNKAATPQEEKKRNSRLDRRDYERLVTGVLSENAGRWMNYKQVAAALKIVQVDGRRKVGDTLEKMADLGLVEKNEQGKYKMTPKDGFVEGTVEREGVKTYVYPEDGSEAIFIPESKIRHALIGDAVKVYKYARRKGRGAEGEIIEVVKRSKETFVGVLHVTEYLAFLVVNNRILANDIYIPKDKLHGAKDGQKAVVRIIDWPEKAKNPVGEVEDILGDRGENNAEMHAILAEYGLPYAYPAEVEHAAAQIGDTIAAEEIARRRDIRGVTTFTIDPKDAKDFDDALSIRKIGDGKWEVGVHIADVTHYVKEGDIIDEEAKSRATSVYLVDRTIPMLPERLSNYICSLRPEEEKLTYSVIFELNDKAEILNRWIGRTVIRSDKRFAYEDAQQIIETGQGDYAEEVLTLNRLASALRTRRFAHGAINFESVEVRFELDDTGKPLSVYFKESKEANHLVEEFMLLANQTVAERIGNVKKKTDRKTFVYRIHDVPNPEKLENLSGFVKAFGYKLKTTGKPAELAVGMNQLLDAVKGQKEQSLIETIAVRTMARAEYSTENIGHYGLAMPYYTHFTSPIRRYPDMMVHRLLTRYMEGGTSVDERRAEELCRHCSEREQLATSAERASIKYKQVEYMKDSIGKTYDGVISGVTEWGVYVELNENKCEGMIPLRELGTDFFVLDEKNYRLKGYQSGEVYALGDPITIRVTKANLDKKQLDFTLVEKD